MTTISYPDMAFARETASRAADAAGGAGDGAAGGEVLRCTLFGRYSFAIPWEKVAAVGPARVRRDEIDIDAPEKRVANKIGLLIEEGIRHHLVHALYRKPAFYITQDSGVPLIGSNEFGVVDRGSNIIEIKPLTGCNFNCTYCSVDEGKNEKSYDYLVELDYLLQVAADVASTKGPGVEFNIGPQAEPLLYPKFVELVRGLKAIPNCEIVSVNTNGSLLSEKLIDDLAEAGLTRVNLSIPALDQELASKLAGIPKFPLQHLLAMLEYGKTKLNFLLAPVVIPGQNEQEMPKIIELSKSLKSEFPTVGIQNYLEYPKGRSPVKKAYEWEEFYGLIKRWEQETGKPLTSTKEDFRIHEEQELPKPFRKDQVVDAIVVMPGRYPREMYAAAQGRAICVQMPNERRSLGKRVRVRIVRDKHNIFKATLA